MRNKYINIGHENIVKSTDAGMNWVALSTIYTNTVTLLNTEISALEVSILPETKIKDIKLNLSKILGSGFSIKNKYEQKESIYKIFKSEKLLYISSME